jgi:glycosyltransferase involved in cell wall biosynthesis
MHIWQINPYGPLPGESWREYRTVLAGRAFVAANHTVMWWVANFEHRSKTFRSAGYEVRSPFPGFDVAIVPTTSYRQHMSIQRIQFERTFARRVVEAADRHRRPDLIVLGEPALFTAAPIVALSKRWKIPIMLDVGDLWPELFEIALPRLLSSLGNVIFWPLYARRAALARYSSGYVAVSRDYLALFQRLAPRRAAAVVYWGVDVEGVRQEMRASTSIPEAVATRAKGPDDFWVVYAGTLGPNYDVAILSAAELLKPNRNVTIFIAGDGESRGDVEHGIAHRALANCVFLGSLPATTVAKLYSACDAALSTYVGRSTVSMPIKAYDYFAAGLPIINSLGGDLEHFVTTRKVGLQYTPEDPRSLADAILVLARDAGLRRSFAENAARLGAEFDWRIQYKGFVNVAEQILERPTAAAQPSAPVRSST